MMPEVVEPGSYDLPAMGQQQTKHRDNGRLSTSLHEASLLHTGRWLVSGKEASFRKSHAQANLGVWSSSWEGLSFRVKRYFDWGGDWLVRK
jgi:hypothetical protein